MEWMLDIQLGRRNLSPIQRIAVAEKYRPIYEKMAKENKILGGGDKKSDEYKKSVTVNLPNLAISYPSRKHIIKRIPHYRPVPGRY